MTELETSRLRLRPWREEDAEDLYEYGSDPRVGPAAGWPPHEDLAESLEIIRTVFSGPETYAMELKDGGKVVGSIGFVGRHRTELPGADDEIGYCLNPAYWGRGLTPEAVVALLRYGFEVLGLDVIWCDHYEGNEKSRRVIEKCGFRYHFAREEDVPLLGERRLTHFYALTRAEWAAGT